MVYIYENKYKNLSTSEIGRLWVNKVELPLSHRMKLGRSYDNEPEPDLYEQSYREVFECKSVYGKYPTTSYHIRDGSMPKFYLGIWDDKYEHFYPYQNAKGHFVRKKKYKNSILNVIYNHINRLTEPAERLSARAELHVQTLEQYLEAHKTPSSDGIKNHSEQAVDSHPFTIMRYNSIDTHKIYNKVYSALISGRNTIEGYIYNILFIGRRPTQPPKNRDNNRKELESLGGIYHNRFEPKTVSISQTKWGYQVNDGPYFYSRNEAIDYIYKIYGSVVIIRDIPTTVLLGG